MNTLGVKAAGLARLPQIWTPPYVALSEDQAAVIAGPDETRSAPQIAIRLRAAPMADALASLFKTAQDGVVARSSAADEDMASRGLYRSAVTTFASFQTTAEAIRDVWDHAEKLDPLRPAIPILVQARVMAQLSGHLSNEVRLKRDRRDWVSEMQGELSETRAFGMRALRADRTSLTNISLECSSPAALRTVLRRIAGALTTPGFRVHVEWLWDGERVWVV